MAHTACLICFVSTVNSHSKKEEKMPIKTGTIRGQIKNLNSLYCLDVYDFAKAIFLDLWLVLKTYYDCK